ncbi:MAG: YqgE/AlgH family protein, partial [Aurantimonas coralicida]|nr:YqgE/AlgH family protein [Aurantimonas coralicida]
TPTIDILKAISKGVGPTTAIMALGYAGWSPGQLESEIAANGWLTCKADLDIVFDAELDSKYDRALGLLGIEPAFLASEAGHA